MNGTYTSERTIHQMVYIMSEKKSLEGIRESDHFLILFDETTDCTVKSSAAVHWGNDVLLFKIY